MKTRSRINAEIAEHAEKTGKRTSERMTAHATGVPERQDFDLFRLCDHAVIDIVANAREEQATHAWERGVPGASTDFRLD